MSASPAPSDADQQPKGQDQTTFRFCRECSNMLYPKEDRVNNQLMFACRTCQFSETAVSSCVFRNNLYNTVGETAGVTQDVGSDPTVGGSSSPCSSCDACLDSSSSSSTSFFPSSFSSCHFLDGRKGGSSGESVAEDDDFYGSVRGGGCYDPASDFCFCTLCGEDIVCESCGIEPCQGLVAGYFARPDSGDIVNSGDAGGAIGKHDNISSAPIAGDATTLR